MKTFIVIPAHNEEENISNVLSEVKKYCENIIVVDDGSTDNTYVIAKSQGVHMVRHVINLKKGCALRNGCDKAIQLGAEVIIVMDSDGQHSPEDLPLFFEKIKNNDIVFGSRKPSKEMPLLLKFGNTFLSKIVQYFFKIKICDTQSGFRAFTNYTYGVIRWSANDYSAETEMLVRAGKHNLKYAEVSIQTIYKDNYKGTTVIDGLKILTNILWWKVTKK